jgi:hypothetical protein
VLWGCCLSARVRIEVDSVNEDFKLLTLPACGRMKGQTSHLKQTPWVASGRNLVPPREVFHVVRYWVMRKQGKRARGATEGIR